MAHVEEFSKAINAHAAWKARLTEAIRSKKSTFSPNTVSTDFQCDFGKWLYGASLTGDDKSTSHYITTKQLHAKFHEIAGVILARALEGNEEQAEMLMAPGSEFDDLSNKLVLSLREWKEVFRER